MGIDTSTLIALLLDEPETSDFVPPIAAAQSRPISASSYLEIAMVMIARFGPASLDRLDRLLDDLSVEVRSFTREQADLAAGAYRQFGRGSGHKAGLNFGDCFSYALAKLLGQPLLFKGDDFVHTDLVPALPS